MKRHLLQIVDIKTPVKNDHSFGGEVLANYQTLGTVLLLELCYVVGDA